MFSCPLTGSVAITVSCTLLKNIFECEYSLTKTVTNAVKIHFMLGFESFSIILTSDIIYSMCTLYIVCFPLIDNQVSYGFFSFLMVLIFKVEIISTDV